MSWTRRARRWFVDHRLVLATGGAAALPIVVSTVRAVVDGWAPLGDDALIAVRSYEVLTAHPPLLGMPSTGPTGVLGEQTFHLGPLLFWLLALPAHFLGPSSLAVTAGLVNVACVMGSVGLAHRRGGRPLMFAAAIALPVMLASLPAENYSDVWNPAVAVLPFTLLLFLAWSLACGEYRLLPLTRAGRELRRPVPPDLPAPRAGRRWPWAWRDWSCSAPRPAATPGVRRWAVAAAVVGLVCWSGPLIDQAVNRPGNLVAARPRGAVRRPGAGPGHRRPGGGPGHGRPALVAAATAWGAPPNRGPRHVPRASCDRFVRAGAGRADGGRGRGLAAPATRRVRRRHAGPGDLRRHRARDGVGAQRVLRLDRLRPLVDLAGGDVDLAGPRLVGGRARRPGPRGGRAPACARAGSRPRRQRGRRDWCGRRGRSAGRAVPAAPQPSPTGWKRSPCRGPGSRRGDLEPRHGLPGRRLSVGYRLRPPAGGKNRDGALAHGPRLALRHRRRGWSGGAGPRGRRPAGGRARAPGRSSPCPQRRSEQPLLERSGQQDGRRDPAPERRPSLRHAVRTDARVQRGAPPCGGRSRTSWPQTSGWISS